MESRAKLLGHPVHQQLVVLPLGLLIMAVVFDLLDRAIDSTVLAQVSFWNIVAGVATALLAAVFGALDWAAIPRGTRAKRIGAVHGLGNVIVVLLFAGAGVLRWDTPALQPQTLALALEVAGLLLGGVTGWLGGELVDRLGVGVDDGAHLDAPNSLGGRPAYAASRVRERPR